MNKWKVIKSIDEITEQDVLERLKITTSLCPNKYFGIVKDDGVYFIVGYVCGDTPTVVGNVDTVLYWKTLTGVKKALKRFSKNGKWGIFKWFNEGGNDVRTENL